MSTTIPNTAYIRRLIRQDIDEKKIAYGSMENRRAVLVNVANELKGVHAASLQSVEDELSSTFIQLTKIQDKLVFLRELLEEDQISPHAIAEVLLKALSLELNQEQVHQFVSALLDLATETEPQVAVAQSNKEVEPTAVVSPVEVMPVTPEAPPTESVVKTTSVTSPQPSIETTASPRNKSEKPTTIDRLSYYDTTVPINWNTLTIGTQSTEQTVMQRFKKLHEILLIKGQGHGWRLEKLPLLAQRASYEHLKKFAIRDPDDQIFIETALGLLTVYDLTVAGGLLHQTISDLFIRAKALIAKVASSTKESVKGHKIDPDMPLAPQLHALLVVQDQRQKAKNVASAAANKGETLPVSKSEYPPVTQFEHVEVPGDILAFVQQNGLSVSTFRDQHIYEEVKQKVDQFVAYIRGQSDSFATNLVKVYKVGRIRFLQMEFGRADHRLVFKVSQTKASLFISVGTIGRRGDQNKLIKRTTH